MIENVLELVKVTENFNDSQTRQKKASCGPRAVALPESELHEEPQAVLEQGVCRRSSCIVRLLSHKKETHTLCGSKTAEYKG